MEFLNSITKYLYILVAIGFIVVLFFVIRSLSKIKKSMGPINNDINLINKHLADIKEKEESIKHATDVSLPFFLKTYAILSISKIVLKDFFKTNPKKRNIKKSVKRIYKLSKSI